MERPILRPCSKYLYKGIEVRYVGKRGIDHIFCPEDGTIDIGNGQGHGKALTDEEILQLKTLFVPAGESSQYEAASLLTGNDGFFSKLKAIIAPDFGKMVADAQKIFDYCQKVGCTPDDLVNAHKEKYANK